ncbi:response regulator [Bradyrhizobium sp. UFLA05-153]
MKQIYDPALISIVDSDPLARESLRLLLEDAGFIVECAASAEDYLEQSEACRPDCIVLEIQLLGRNGLALQTQLANSEPQTPLVFVTIENNVRTSVLAMKAGAVDYLTKPFQGEEVLAAVRSAVALNRVDRAERRLLQTLRTLFTSLSPRERETMGLLAAGNGVKQIAGQMGVRPHTARVHSSRVMLKMGARSIADLARMADKLEHDEGERSRCKATRICQPHQSHFDYYLAGRDSERFSTAGPPYRQATHA